MRSEGLDIDERFGQEYAGHYVFREITWAKRSRVCHRNTKYSKMTGQVESSDFVAIQAESIWASLKQQPESKPISLEKLLGEEEGIPIELGELFSKVVNRLNGVGRDELRFLLEQLSEENRTQLLASLGYAKSSAGLSLTSEGSQQKASSSS